MLNPISYLRGWFDGKGIEHDDSNVEQVVHLYNTHFMADGGVFSISWGYACGTGNGLTMGYPDKVEGVYLEALEFGAQPTPYTIDEIKELVCEQH